MIDFFLLGLFYSGVVAAGISLVVFFILLCEGYKMTKAQKPVKIEPEDIGLSKWELDDIVKQVMKNDRKRTSGRRGYAWLSIG